MHNKSDPESLSWFRVILVLQVLSGGFRGVPGDLGVFQEAQGFSWDIIDILGIYQ